MGTTYWLAAAVMGFAPPNPDEGSTAPIDPVIEVMRTPGAASTCPALRSVPLEVEDLLGQRLAEVPGLELRFTITAEPVDMPDTPNTRWQVEVRERGGYTRTLSGSGCAEVASAAALVIATMIDPIAVTSSAPEPEPEPAAEPAAAPEPKTEPEPELEPEPEPEPFRMLGVSPRFSVSGGTLPGAGLAATLALGAQFERIRVEVAPSVWPSRTTTTSGITTAVSGFDVSTRACFVPKWRRVELWGCGGLLVGAARGRASGPQLTGASDARIFWGAVTAGAGLGVRVRPWIVPLVTLEGQLPFSRPRFTVAGAGPQHVFAPVGVVGAIGVELRWVLRGG